MSMRIIATCALGLEELLEAELVELGMAGVSRQRGSVSFRGAWRQAYRACWWLRTANRVLVELASWGGASGDQLYAGARRLVARSEGRWGGLGAARLFAPRRTFAIRATTARSQQRDVRWVALRVKDGLVDGQRERFGRRSSIDRRDPDLALRVWLYEDRATLLLDATPTPLDRRGYRLETTAAPLREQLAAACVLASGWDGQGPVVDPMCGSGTLLAEAASWATRRPPLVLRRSWGLERLPGFRRQTWDEVRRERALAPAAEVALFGVDRDPTAVRAARVNLQAAGWGDHADLRRGDGFEFEPPAGPGLVLVNPAYGERLEQAAEQWRRLGDLLKQRYKGWRAVVLAGDASRGKWIGLRPARRLPVRNGPIDARILTFELY